MFKNLTENQSYLLLFVACIITRVATSIYYIEDIDSLRFALSIEHYDISKLQPHFPGYPVFCFIAKILFLITGSKAASFSIIGGVSVFAIIFFILKISKIEINNRIGIFCSFIIFFNPMIWLMSNRYMPDLMGLALSVAAIYYFTQKNNNTKNLAYAFIITGLLAGVRLSYIPLLIIPFVHNLIINRQRTYLLLSLLLGFTIWFLPLIIMTGYEDLYVSASKQTLGHFTDFGGTVITDNNFYFRSMNLFRSVWADGLGGYWYGRSWQTAILSISYLYFLFLGYIGIKKYLKYDKDIRMIIYCIVLYTLWIFFFQNVIYKTRHILPVLILVFIIATIGQKYISDPKSIFFNTIVGAFYIALVTVTSTLVTQHQNPTAVSKVKDNISIEDDITTIISSPLINYYMKRHGVRGNYISVEDEDKISAFNSTNEKGALLIGNFQELFADSYKVIPENTFFHNPYVNRMWPQINTFSIVQDYNGLQK